MNREPLLNRALIVSIVAALLTLLVAFNAPITDEQQTAITGFVAVIAPIVVAVLARPHVTPSSDPRGENTEGRMVDLVPVDGSQLKGERR